MIVKRTDQILKMSLWEKCIKIHIAFDDGFQKGWCILKNDNATCPRCSEAYSGIKHNTEYICKKCQAEFYFAGAMHPEPLEEVRQEIIEAAKKEGVTLNPKPGIHYNA